MLSVVVPFFNERSNLPELYRRLRAVFDARSYEFELILVNDGSTDDSENIAEQLADSDNRVKVVTLSRNFGHQVALTAGLDFATGKAVVMMDADLQHPPELIPKLISKWEEGFDIVNTVRIATSDAGPFKTTTSDLFYRLINRLADIRLTPGSADFRLLDHSVANQLRRIRERDRFIRGLISWIGFRCTEVPYEADARFSGKSKYSIVRMARFAFDGVTSFSSVPLQFASIAGAVISVASFFYAVGAIYARFFTDRTIEGWTSVIVAVLFLGGMQLLCLGILGCYLGRVYNEIKGRPLYLVQNLRGFGRSEDSLYISRSERKVCDSAGACVSAAINSSQV